MPRNLWGFVALSSKFLTGSSSTSFIWICKWIPFLNIMVTTSWKLLAYLWMFQMSWNVLGSPGKCCFFSFCHWISLNSEIIFLRFFLTVFLTCYSQFLAFQLYQLSQDCLIGFMEPHGTLLSCHDQSNPSKLAAQVRP